MKSDLDFAECDMCQGRFQVVSSNDWVLMVFCLGLLVKCGHKEGNDKDAV